MNYPKQQYFRSKKHLKNVAALPCQHCGLDSHTQAAHSNWVEFGGKAKSIKASDEYTAALCLKCHYDIDQGAHMSKEERQKMWHNAHLKTVELIVSRGEWPVDVPAPSVTM